MNLTNLLCLGLGFFMTFFYICIYIIRLIMVSEICLSSSKLINSLIVPDRISARPSGQWRFRCLWSSWIHCACSLKVRTTGTDHVRHSDFLAIQTPAQV